MNEIRQFCCEIGLEMLLSLRLQMYDRGNFVKVCSDQCVIRFSTEKSITYSEICIIDLKLPVARFYD